MLAHNVYFTLEDPTPPKIQGLIAACEKYLRPHPGVAFFAAGPRVPDLTRPVNEQDFHVGLHVIFESRKDHDRYQDAPLHHQFIAEQKGNWKHVRVFDSETVRH